MAAVGKMSDLLKERDVTPHTKDGKCSGCGECCTDILPLTKKEVSRIRDYIQRKHIPEYRNVMLANSYDLTCPFRNEDKGICTIYEVRPEICRDFMCDKDPKEMMKNRDLMHKTRQIVLMRHEFYGSDMDVKVMEMLRMARRLSNGQGPRPKGRT